MSSLSRKWLVPVGMMIGLVSSAQAALVGRLPATVGGTDYQAYYDDDLDVTWIANANLAATETFGVANINANGTMKWGTAKAWVGAMNVNDYLGFSDWRLPYTFQPDPTCSNQTIDEEGVVTSYGVDCTGSDMGHLYYVEGVTSGTPGPFSNVMDYYYWSGTPYYANENYAWDFHFAGPDIAGNQNYNSKANYFYVWAVRDGDVSQVPLPRAIWLFAGALLGVAGVARRRA